MNFDPLCDIELDKLKQLKFKLRVLFKHLNFGLFSDSQLNDIFQLSYDFCLKTKNNKIYPPH